MAKSVFFKVRSRKRSKRKRNGSKLFVVVLVVALLGVGVVHYVKQPAALPTMAGASSLQETSTSSFVHNLYLRILSQVIPGFGESVALAAEPENEIGKNDGKQSTFVGFVDPRDPKVILSGQIPYMATTEPLLQPLINPVGQKDRASDEPRIVIPVRSTLNGEGKIVIYHTHTTESFAPTSGRNFTDNLTLSVAQLGEELADILQKEYGIPVVHNKEIHDIPRTPAYQKALPTITELLTQNPDTGLVIDLHRDGVSRSVSTTNLDDQSVGRLMFMVGTRNNPYWQQNSTASNFLHDKLETIAPGLSRGVRERPLMYNQHVHPISLLIEVGGHENSLEEVRRSLPVLAKALAELYQSGLQ